MSEFYALVNEKRLEVFLITASTILMLNKKIQSFYISKKGMMEKGKPYTLDDYLKDKKIVNVTIIEVNHE
jgi:hypothetical protein